MYRLGQKIPVNHGLCYEKEQRRMEQTTRSKVRSDRVGLFWKGLLCDLTDHLRTKPNDPPGRGGCSVVFSQKKDITHQAKMED